MAEKLEDFNLPMSVVQRIIKEAITENLNIAKEARIALARAAAVFVLYITSQSSLIAQKANRKTLTGDDVFEALRNLEFDDLIEPLQKSLQEYKESYKKKDKNVSTSKAAEEDQGEEIEEIEDDNEDE
ncbi:hypothetical protein RN001_009790 [Aquatica leii]|uniref:DNA polymerase epsilon subunit 3 n=1 Tax=Aquatica leii TaxID=1421715 RepID=A0AAN7P593_9COLE|nr:hypothetical protein RN001_009790 [Aquatica leii]